MKNNLKNEIAILAIFLTIVICNRAIAQTAPLQPVFYLHGFTADASQMDNLATEMMRAWHFNWTQKGELPSYYSAMFAYTNTIPNTAIIVNNTLQRTADYIGVGYSAGGLVARSIDHRHPNDGFMRGIVTINTPNRGAWMANGPSRETFAFQYAAAQAQIFRGDYGVLGWAGTSIITLLFALPVTAANMFDQTHNRFMADMDANSVGPGSSTYINDINNINGAQQAAERNLATSFNGGVASCWGQMTSPLMPAFNDFVNGQTNYFSKINLARNNANQHSQTANRIKSGKKWWQFWKLFPIWWNQMRASDWNASADGLIAANDAWETGIGVIGQGDDGRTASDAFILVPSQLGDPAVPAARRFQLKASRAGNCSHNVAVADGTDNYNQIEAAMRSVGAQ